LAIHSIKKKQKSMATVKLINYEDATAEVKAVFDDIKTTRNVADVNNFWKALANQPQNLQRVWNNVKEVMGNGAIDSLTKEMIYIAVSIINNCDYCVHTHGCRHVKRYDGRTISRTFGGRYFGKHNKYFGEWYENTY
jgi:alkylhydroperoxidase family enzyme